MKTKLYLAFMTLTTFGFLKINAQSNKSLSNLTSPTAVNQSLLPSTNNTADLGSSALGWRNLYLSNHLYLKGKLTMHSPNTGSFFVGSSAGNGFVSGFYNTGTGVNASNKVTAGSSNTANGYNSLWMAAQPQIISYSWNKRGCRIICEKVL